MKKYLVLLPLLLSSCGANKAAPQAQIFDDSRLHRTYLLSYDQPTQELTFFSQAKVGGMSGTSVDSSKPSSFYADTKVMERKEDKVKGIYYEWKVKTEKLRVFYYFSFQRGPTDPDVSRVPMAAALNPAKNNIEWKGNAPLKLEFVGSANRKEETTYYLVEIDGKNRKVVFELGKEVQVSKKDLEITDAVKTFTVQPVRVYQKDSGVKEREIFSSSEYRGSKIEITIER
jgi:hypothetical protein